MSTRTTLSIDDDVPAYARQLSEVSGRPLGAVISELARTSIRARGDAVTRNGVELLPARANGQSATLEDVNTLRDATA